MRPLCGWVERSVGISIARGTALASPWMLRHMRRCPQCARAAAEMRAIRDALPSALEAPEYSDAFMAGVWAAIDTTASKPGRRRTMPIVAWTGAVAAAVTLAVIPAMQARRSPVIVAQNATRGQVTSPKSPVIVTEKTQMAEPLRNTARAGTRPKTDADRRSAERDTAAESAAIRRMLRLRRRMAGDKTRVSPPLTARIPAPQDASTEAPKVTATVGWVEMAHYYEAQSDLSSAAYAYRQALRERRDPDTAFAAGRTSEAAGDILSAVECFADLLDRADLSGSSNEGAAVTEPRRRVADA